MRREAKRLKAVLAPEEWEVVHELAIQIRKVERVQDRRLTVLEVERRAQRQVVAKLVAEVVRLRLGQG